VPYPDAERWVSAATVSGGKAAATSRSRAGLQTLQPREVCGGIIVCVYVFWRLKRWNFDNPSYLAVFKAIFISGLILVVAILRQTRIRRV
jgi:hypothetical protein